MAVMPVIPDSEAVLRRMREVLGKLIQLSDMTRVEIGERLGGGPHLVRRILNGDTELKARHILEIAELIGIWPIEFFHIVFEGEPAKPSPLIEKMGELAAELDSYRAGALGREREAGEQRPPAGARTQGPKGAQGAQAGKRARRRPGPGGRKGRAKGRG
jgi:transcriptional regulator with XRE-family HTH domain